MMTNDVMQQARIWSNISFQIWMTLTYELFVVDKLMNSTFRMSSVECKYASQKPACDFLFYDNGNVYYT